MKKIVPLLVLLSSFCLTACVNSGGHHDVKEYMSDLEYHDDFRVVQFSDLHLSSQRNLQVDYDYLTNLVNIAKKEKPVDLIVFTGDIFTFASKLTVAKTFETFNSWGIPWTLTFGNHDEQIFADYEFTAREASKYSNCLFKFIDDNMTGLTNSIINLKSGDVTKYQFYIVDSNTYSFKKDGVGYDYVHEDQIEWYKEGIKAVNTDLEHPAPSMVFQHIPLIEINEAIKEYEADPSIGTGVIEECCSPSKINGGFFEAIKECKSTKAVVVGHDHVNNADINYQGVHFIYGAKSTDNIYHDDDKLGFRSFEVRSDGSFTTKLNYYTYSQASELAKEAK